MKKILLINPPNYRYFSGIRAYNGLGYLSAVLKEKNIDVRVLDYVGNPEIPEIKKVVEEYQPHAIGISAFTDVWNSIKNIIEKELTKYNLPIILGGPHTAVSTEEVKNYPYVDAIALGESENIICDVVNEIVIRKEPKIYFSTPVDVNEVPFPNLDSFYGSHEYTSYSLISSRGCPYDCSFCCSRLTSSKKWRAREIQNCMEEIQQAVKKYPTIGEIWLMDDNFNLKKERGKVLIESYLKNGFKQKLTLANIRADSIDKELIYLCKKIGMESITISVEHANQEVFEHIKKGETLEEIKDAIELCKNEGLFVNILMIVGLPFDNFERTKESIRFVKKYKPNANAWSMMNPYPGTRAKKWFLEHGKIYDSDMLMFEEDNLITKPICETPDFTLKQREKAYLMARLETASYDLRHPFVIIKALPAILKHNLLLSLIRGFHYGFWVRLRRVLKRMRLKYAN